MLRNKVIKYESSPSLGELSLTQRHKRERRARARGGIKSPVGFISGTNPVINLHTNGVRPYGRAGSGFDFDPLPGVVILKLLGA